MYVYFYSKYFIHIQHIHVEISPFIMLLVLGNLLEFLSIIKVFLGNKCARSLILFASQDLILLFLSFTLYCSISQELSKTVQIFFTFEFTFEVSMFNIALVSNITTVSINDESEKKNV